MKKYYIVQSIYDYVYTNEQIYSNLKEAFQHCENLIKDIEINGNLDKPLDEAIKQMRDDEGYYENICNIDIIENPRI